GEYTATLNLQVGNKLAYTGQVILHGVEPTEHYKQTFVSEIDGSVQYYGYDQIRAKYEPDAEFEQFWDEKSQAPYMYNAADSLMVSYDDTVSVVLKTQYAIEKGLGGIMFWELGNDTKQEGSLLDAIFKVAQKENR